MLWLEGFATHRVTTLTFLPTVKLCVGVIGLLGLLMLWTVLTGAFIRFVIIVHWKVTFKRLEWEALFTCVTFIFLFVLIMHHHVCCEASEGLLCFATSFFQAHKFTLTTMFFYEMSVVISPFFQTPFCKENKWVCASFLWLYVCIPSFQKLKLYQIKNMNRSMIKNDIQYNLGLFFTAKYEK